MSNTELKQSYNDGNDELFPADADFDELFGDGTVNLNGRESMSTATDDYIGRIIDAFDRNGIDKTTVLYQIRLDAAKEGVQTEKLVSAYIKELETATTREDQNLKLDTAKNNNKLGLALSPKAKPEVTISNFYKIMKGDTHYKGVRYNLLTNAPEIDNIDSKPPTKRRWTDADEAASKEYIEAVYGIHSDGKHSDALRLLFRDREYHPIRDIVDSLVWDETDRIESFLSKWAKVDDTAYSREVSRLIFAGGIHRLYNPGCKFDDVPVLIGTRQGEGKSTLVRWLAMNDAYFKEVTEIDGQRSIEQLSGAWICEIAELLALTKVKEQAAVKAYITRQTDSYRQPYDKNTTDLPRQCIFIGTTNNEHFLKDQTGNRRFYPITVHSTGYDLFDHEAECKAYIEQCWAEAKAKINMPFMKHYATPELINEYRSAQAEATEDDWRIGVIGEYLSRFPVGGRICVKMVWDEALSASRDAPLRLDKRDSNEIAQIINRVFGDEWESKTVIRIQKYGRTRGWERVKQSQIYSESDSSNSDDEEELPF